MTDLVKQYYDGVMTANTATKRVLVVGLGISGMASAVALRRSGWDVTIVERSAQRRRGGYFIALLDAGQTAVEQLGLHGVHDRSPQHIANFSLDRTGRKVPGVGFADRLDAPWMMLRGDVEKAAYEALDDQVQIRYATVPTAIEQDEEGVSVTLLEGQGAASQERFDLVIGADGVHSSVRRLVFGPDEDYLHHLGYMIAACEMPQDLPGLARGEGANLAEVGRSFWVFPFADRPSTVLFSYRTADPKAEFTLPPVQRLREVYGPQPLGATMSAAVAELESADEFLFDEVVQVRMDSWRKGRVILMGDAAWCVCLYSGMGATSGLVGANVLGALLAQQPDDLEGALAQWESRMRPFIADNMRLGERNRFFFTPATRAGRLGRAAMMWAIRQPWGRSLALRLSGRGTKSHAAAADITPAWPVAVSA